MTRKQKRLLGIGAIGVVLLAAVMLVLTALQDEIVFFYSPTDIVEENKVKPGQRFRIGGLVKDGSLVKAGAEVTFVVTDTNHDVTVNYSGILPDLFREGQGIVAEGALVAGGAFTADTVLAKHDENYMPKEVADSLKEQGVWQETKEN